LGPSIGQIQHHENRFDISPDRCRAASGESGIRSPVQLRGNGKPRRKNGGCIGGFDSHPVSALRVEGVIALFLALVGLAMAIYLVSVGSFANLQPANIGNGEVSMLAAANKGIVERPSNHSVEQTVDRLKNILQAKGVTLFALIDHSGEAEKVGMKMPPTKLLIFGNPKGGTPLMLAAPSSAIDLPLKILVSEDGQGNVWISYNSPQYLQNRHEFPQELLANIAVVETLAVKAAE
jgi:uncharacterized protein (DUF302 family)